MRSSLTVLTAYFNPARYRSRRRNYARFAEHVRATPAARLLTIECAFGVDPFELDADGATIQVRADHPLWIKENLLNIGLARTDTEFVAWIDCDVLFQDPGWAEQSVDALHTCQVIQPWGTVYCLDAEGRRADDGVPSFGRVHRTGYEPGCRAGCCHTGYAWAARRDVLEAAGGFVEDLILGGADHLMAVSIFDSDRSLWPKAITGPYRERVDAWCRRYSGAVQRKLGYIDGDLHHLFHGRHADRRYGERHAIPLIHGYDPGRHLRKNADGVNQLVDHPALCGHISRYFTDRLEDCSYRESGGPMVRA